MTRIFALIFFISPFLQADAQVTVTPTLFDFGVIEYFSNDTAYFKVYNSGAKAAYLLPTQPDDEYSLLCSKKKIEPGETITIGIVYYTADKGKFEKKVKVFFSSSGEPVILTIRGNIKQIAATAYTTCPSIENSAPLQPSQVPLTIYVKDASSGEFIPGAKVDVLNNNKQYHCVPGFGNTIYSCNTRYGPCQINVTKVGYLPARSDFLYDKDNHRCLILLEKKIDSSSVAYEETTVVSDSSGKDIYQPEIVNPVYVPVAHTDSGFNSHRYKPNHLIFIVDISGSMKDSNKLAYLKTSMYRLFEVIRPIDYVTLITYTTKVRVVFEHISGASKSWLIQALDTLKAGGGSNGSQSLVIAYELANKYFIKGGNNQIFLATDGLLNSSKISNEDLYKLVAGSQRKTGVILSTVAFGDNPKALEFLKKLAEKGHGSILRILRPDEDVAILIDEVKIRSSR